MASVGVEPGTGVRFLTDVGVGIARDVRDGTPSGISVVETVVPPQALKRQIITIETINNPLFRMILCKIQRMVCLQNSHVDEQAAK